MDADTPKEIRDFIHNCLTGDEIRQIDNQLTRACVPNRQVFWTGMHRSAAEHWADHHGFQTLTMAMGALMDPSSEQRPRRGQSDKQWTIYVHGASAMFAWHISKGDSVTVLAHPPLQRFHPSGRTSFQVLEWPIITGKAGNKAVGSIRIVHPAEPRAVDFSYQLWPKDDMDRWISRYGTVAVGTWRAVKEKQQAATSGLMIDRVAAEDWSKFGLVPSGKLPPGSPSRATQAAAAQRQGPGGGHDGNRDTSHGVLEGRHLKQLQKLRESQAREMEALRARHAKKEGKLGGMSKRGRKKLRRQLREEKDELERTHDRALSSMQRQQQSARDKHRAQQQKLQASAQKLRREALSKLESQETHQLRDNRAGEKPAIAKGNKTGQATENELPPMPGGFEPHVVWTTTSGGPELRTLLRTVMDFLLCDCCELVVSGICLVSLLYIGLD